MDWPAVAAVIVTIAALASFVNARWLRIPSTIGPMAITLAVSLALVLVARFTAVDVRKPFEFVLGIDFRTLLLSGLLPFVFFAGALNVKRDLLREQAPAVAALVLVGVAISATLVGALLWEAAQALGMSLTFPQALLFGALIAPTDPVAVLGILRDAKTPRALEGIMSGEALLNDGVGVVLFLALFGVAVEGEPASLAAIGGDFLREAVGGVAFGLALGGLGYLALRAVDDYPVEILITLAIAAGGYTAANAIGVSGPLATVAAGLVIGGVGRRAGMSERTRTKLDSFWHSIDEMLNVVVFMLVGLEMMVVAVDMRHLALGAVAIPVVLLARWVSVALPLAAIGARRRFPRGTSRLLAWAGLRGAISIALALSLPAGALRDTLLTATYLVVLFSVLVQGLTLGRVARHLAPSSAPQSPRS